MNMQADWHILVEEGQVIRSGVEDPEAWRRDIRKRARAAKRPIRTMVYEQVDGGVRVVAVFMDAAPLTGQDFQDMQRRLDAYWSGQPAPDAWVDDWPGE